MSDKRRTTEQVIGSLSSGLTAVRPLRPPVQRLLLWLSLVVVLVAVPIVVLGRFNGLIVRLTDPRFFFEWMATVATGLLAILASLNLSIPGRSEVWRYAPLPPLILWLAMSGLGCLKNGLGEIDLACLVFIVATSVPLSFLAFVLLRRARPYAPWPVAITGALGVAALGAALLQFFHPFDVTVLDLSTHVFAIALVVAIAGTFGRRQLATS